jgi:uncharacterized protein involved in exopolysaccharide biosynthesis
MDQDLDLREYIAVLLQYKFWIVGLAIGAAAVALVISLLLPPVYEATALVAITKPKYEMRFDPRFELVGSNILPPYKAYPVLAMGDELLSTLIADLDQELATDERNVETLRDMLSATSAADPSIVTLSVKDGDALRSATIANRWAAHFVAVANELYAPSQDDLTFYTEQRAETEFNLDQAEEDLIDFQARNRAMILTVQLDSKQAALKEYLAAARAVSLIIQDARALRDRLLAEEASTAASPSDELTALLLEIDALNQTELPIQLQIPVQQDLGDKTVGDQIAFLDSLVKVLESKEAVLAQEALAMEPDILELQMDLESVRVQEDRLRTVKEMARETFVSLSRKATEARIAAQDSTGQVRLASRATPSTEPASPRRLFNTAIGGVLGLLVGILSAYAIEFWQRGQSRAEAAD